ncbi:GerAB/ArcD/ProY family transporter [Paenibacillus harenae]|uniref:GerAB/ArcD/ProY family transporter n=1 Tax=Paenibacillus harenae TaxID=306543 RepID=UPI0003F69C5C|nr:GerAB/ArcD/ProY family transporter [Paenibacillus harenae]
MIKPLSLAVTFIYIHLSMSFFLFPEFLLTSTDAGFWQPLVINALLQLAFLLLLLIGLRKFPNRDAIEIVNPMGKLWSLILFVPLAIQFFFCALIMVRGHSELVSMIFLPLTPVWLITLLFVIIALYGALCGLKTILRTSLVISAFCLPIICFSLLTTAKLFDIDNFFPLSDGFSFVFNRSYYRTFTLYTGFLFLCFVPTVTHVRIRWIAVAWGGFVVVLLFSVYMPVLIYGSESAATLRFPVIAAMDSVELPWLIFDRITMIYSICTMIFVFLYISVMVWAVGYISDKLAPRIPKRMMIILTSAALFIGAHFVKTWHNVEQLIDWTQPLRLYSMTAIPLGIFIIATLRKGNET